MDVGEEKSRRETLKILALASAIAFPLGVGGCIGIAYAAVELSWSPALTGLLFGTILVAVIVTAAVFYLTRMYIRPLSGMEATIKRMNQRDFTGHVESAFKEGMFRDLFDGPERTLANPCDACSRNRPTRPTSSPRPAR